MSNLGSMFEGIRTAVTGLTAERARIDVIARNIANAHTTRTPSGGPYRRQVVHFEPIVERTEDGRREVRGVRVAGVEEDNRSPFERIFDPSHPDADAQGFVRYPNVHATQEMADLITAMRAYEAGIVVQENFVAMAERALRLAQ
jgi:flagellar basal-body rod protein FlgC